MCVCTTFHSEINTYSKHLIENELQAHISERQISTRQNQVLSHLHMAEYPVLPANVNT